jgi:predicted nucleic acid-binding protein
VNTFVDTSAFYSLADSRDRHHEQAQSLYQAQIGTAQFYTSDLVMAETWLLLRGRLGRRAALQWWDGVRLGIVDIVFARPADLEAAWRIAQRYDDQDLSLVDCVSFAIMERLGIETAFAYDHHFGLYRFGLRSEKAFRLLT